MSARPAMLPPLPCDQTRVAVAAGEPAHQACRRSPSAVAIARSSTPGGGSGTSGAGKKISRSSGIQEHPAATSAATTPAPAARRLGGRPGNGGGCGERSGGCERRARSSLLRRAFRHASSVVAALAALAPRLVRLAHHHYPDGLLEIPARLLVAGRLLLAALDPLPGDHVLVAHAG